MAVGSLEPQFYAKLMEGLELDLPQLSDFESSRESIASKFLSMTQNEWVKIFSRLDACVTPILELSEAPKDPQNEFRKSFVQNPHSHQWEPAPAPKLSRTPGVVKFRGSDLIPGENSSEVLKEHGYSEADIENLITEKIIQGAEERN